jgi:hypothetical protein
MFRNLSQDWNLHLRVKMEINLVTLAQQQSDDLASQGKFTAAIAFLKYVLLFNAEEYDACGQIADLYEKNHQQHEAKKWRLKAENLQSTKNL